ncbi:hypothetical protein ACP275_06G034600 [Erythranthe tilingii]
MRTRFVPTDYSTTFDAAGSCGPVETLGFVRLPLPRLPPDLPPFSANFLESFNETPIFGNSCETEKLPIDDALSIFFSDVLPHFVGCASFEEPKIGLSDEKTEEKYGTTSNKKNGNGLRFVQFETPEMDTSLLPSQKSAVNSHIQYLHIFSELPDAQFPMDPLNSELMLQDHPEIQQSLYSVDDMSVEYPMEQKTDMWEDTNSVQGKLHSHNIKFPLFEVDVESLGVPGGIYMTDELLSFENIEKQMVEQPAEIIINNKELLGSTESDLLKYLLDHCVATDCLEDTNISSEIYFISIIELSNNEGYSTLHHGKPDGDLIWSMEPILFDEFLFLDLDPYYFCEVLSDSAKETDAETCESMFEEVMNFNNFSQLIVCHELTLMDDSFKSLPVPIFSDHRNSSSHKLLEELLAQLDWQSSSASDGLYLDWHFLGADDCEPAKYPSCWKLLPEIETYKIDADINSSVCEKLIFDFILSEGHSDKPNAENYKEVLNLSCNDAPIYHSSGKADLSSSCNQGDGKRISGDISSKNSVEKVPMFGESMSSDLEFFLNPRNYAIERESITANKLVDTNTVCQVLPTDDSAAANGTTELQQKLNVKLCQKKHLDSPSAQVECNTKRGELLNTTPAKQISSNDPAEAVNEVDNCTVVPVQSMPVGLESEQNLSCEPFCPKIVVIVNTRNFNAEMVISRRSTYQRILKMEQGGAQVVERDISLPVDVIVSSGVSLTWYDCKNIGKKASAPDEAFSCLPLCVESIAASILTDLSFAFNCCILIFEGECNFLSSIMESSDELYAAAASLGIDIQIFCSYSYEMTEEIILSCIKATAGMSRNLYPKMLDSESLAESFLTAFPSINPLSAHAILSSDAILGKFLEMSKGGKICALQKYQVPDESVALLSAITRYGEREDSKSGLTDCSSSVSLPDSENVQFKLESERKKPKYTHKLYNACESPNDLFHMEPLKFDQHNYSKLSVPCNSWLSERAEISDKTEQFSLSFNDNLLSHSTDVDTDMIKKSIDMSSLNEFPLRKGLQIPDEREKTWMPQIDTNYSPRRRSATASKNFSRQSMKGTGILQEDFPGEGIVEDTPAFMENVSVANSPGFSPFLLDVEKDYVARNSRVSKRPLSATNLPTFEDHTDLHSASATWVSKNDKRQILREKIKPHFDTINRNNSSAVNEKGILDEDMIEKLPQDSYKFSFQDKDTQSFGGTPLSNALHSTQQQGSPWTIEFLNRIREKSRLRKQSVSYDLSSPCFASPGNTSKFTKRKSPSILEFYKYDGGSTQQKMVDKKIRKRPSQPLKSLKNNKASTSYPPSCTPVDKKARRALSFSTNGSGGQSKLVWRENNYHTTPTRF